MSIARLVTLGLIITAPIAGAESKSQAEMRGLKPQDNRYLNRLILRCNEQGDGRACSEYSEILSEADGLRNERLSVYYLRRACQLAYQPACSRKSAPKEIKVEGASTKSKCGSLSDMIGLQATGSSLLITSIEPNSPFEKSGIKTGDQIVKVNGKEIKSQEDIDKEFESSASVNIDVNRNGKNLSLPVNCK